jgi:DNA-binding Lrp family transcriptional regulator
MDCGDNLMDKLDSRILNLLQNDFPLAEKPYEELSGKLGISCEQLWKRVANLINDGTIRRIGTSIDSNKFGFCSTLAAISVKSDLVERASEIIGKFSEVTHSYLRSDHYNIWFTLIAPDTQRIRDILKQIQSDLSLDDSQILNLPMKRLFKLNARFNISP